MTDLILALIALLLALLGIVARKTYFYLPPKELKRQAARHDPLASQLYRAVAYGNSLRGLLWLYIGLSSATSLILLARLLPIWASLLIVGPLIWITFSLLPATRTTRLGEQLTTLITPSIVWLLNIFYPMLSRSSDVVEKRMVAKNRTRVFETEDLIELLEEQQDRPDSRVSDETLEIAKRALQFGDYKVEDIMTPRKQVKTVLANDTIGPILIDELHKSRQDYVLVRESKKGPFVGTLAFKQLNLGSHGKVGDIMDPTVYYLHEDDSLNQALHAFFLTNRSLFVVINELEEHVGILSIEDVLRQLLGHIPGDDFDQYANAVIVAGRHKVATGPTSVTDDAAEVGEAETPDKTDDEVVE